MFNLYFMLVILFHSISCEDSTDPKHFRLNKYNEIWAKAEEKIPMHKLERLKGILRKLDKKELDFKHIKAEGGTYDKDMEKSIHNYLYETLRDYGLLDEETFKKMNIKFEDPKLIQLWHNAVHDADFTAEELVVLKEELHHVQDGLKHHHKLAKEISEHDDEDTETGDQEKVKEMKTKRKQAKDKHSRMNEKLSEIHQKIQDRVGHSESGFTDSRVVHLWDKANRGNQFTEDELKSIKEELRHFQVRIDKLRHWNDVSADLKTRYIDNKEYKLREEYDHSKQTIIDHKKFIKKYHQTMKEKLNKHQEL